MRPAIEVINREIEHYQKEIAVLQGKVRELEHGKDILENAYRGQQSVLQPSADKSRSDSIPQLVYNIMRREREEMSADVILEHLKAEGRSLDRNILQTAINREIRRNQIFKTVRRGVYALLEWEEADPESPDHSETIPKEVEEPYLEDDIPF